MTSDPVQDFDKLLSSSELLFVVYYRGHWCPFCISHLHELSSLSSTLSSANCTPLIVTAESEAHLPLARSASGYSGAAIVDPSHLLAKELQHRGWLNVAITNAPIIRRNGYEHGMAQPAVLVMKKDGTVLENWAINPTMMNLGGATDRPKLKEIWENANAKNSGTPTAYESYSSTGVFGLLREKLFGKG